MTLKIAKSNRSLKTETEIAVLQVQVKNVEEKVDEVKVDLKHFTNSVSNNLLENTKILREIQTNSDQAHTQLESKISAMDKRISGLEKWRWMMMGAGIALGAMGSDVLTKLVKLFQ